ncbi:pectin lyase-like protein, partial [Apiospora marii]|uniref:pectin lyase-like protein n=1 Tax=Apiospora marii TaxID=335849 RepID=UPI00312F5E0E
MKLSVYLHSSVLASVGSAYWLPETLDCVKTCVVPKNETGTDDTPNIVKTTAECGDQSRVVFETGLTYNLWTPLQLKNLSNVEFVFDGNASLPDNVSYVESVVADTSIYPGRWINFQGNNVTLTGSKDPENGWFIGNGELWWPAGAANSVNKGRPHFFSLKVDYLRARHLKVWKPVAWVFSMGGSHVWMTDTFIDARSDDGFPFNTGERPVLLPLLPAHRVDMLPDGIDMSASHSLIDGFTIYNGDDLINVSPPTTNVTVRNMYSSGGHGIAVSCASGAGGNYLFENAVVEDSLMGARFKGALGTTCDLRNVAWRNFTVRNTSYPIHFIENYVDQEKGVPPGRNVSLAAYATNFTWENFVGQTGESLRDGSCISDPCWSATLGKYRLPPSSTDKGIYLLCADADYCKDFHFKNIDLKAYDGKPAEMECTGLNGIT